MIFRRGKCKSVSLKPIMSTISDELRGDTEPRIYVMKTKARIIPGGGREGKKPGGLCIDPCWSSFDKNWLKFTLTFNLTL